MVHGTIAHVELVHHIHHAHDDLGIMCSITVDLHVEDVSATCQIVIRSLDLGLMTGRALVIYRHMVGVGVIVAIRDTRNDTELLTILLRELTAEALGRCSQHRIVMMITITELVHSITHVSDDLQTQFLTLGTLAMVFSCKSHQTFSQTYETYTQRTLINDTLNGIHRSQFLGTDPKTLHQQRELLSEGRLLELETIVELFGCHFEHIIEFGKEHINALLLVLLIHTLNGKLHNVDGGEGKVTTSDGSLGSEAILEHTCTTTHRGHLVYIALRVVSAPLAILIIRSIEVQEVGEETAGRHLTGQLVEVEVTILRKSLFVPESPEGNQAAYRKGNARRTSQGVSQ